MNSLHKNNFRRLSLTPPSQGWMASARWWKILDFFGLESAMGSVCGIWPLQRSSPWLLARRTLFRLFLLYWSLKSWFWWDIFLTNFSFLMMIIWKLLNLSGVCFIYKILKIPSGNSKFHPSSLKDNSFLNIRSQYFKPT